MHLHHFYCSCKCCKTARMYSTFYNLEKNSIAQVILNVFFPVIRKLQKFRHNLEKIEKFRTKLPYLITKDNN